MKVSKQGLAEIASHEGIVASRYLDSVGVWTIGIGHTASAGDPNPRRVTRTLSIPEVMEIFERDIQRFENRVNQAVKVKLKQHEFDALVSFDFNTGGIFRAQLTKHLNNGDRNAAANAFMGWSKPPEIIQRRKAEKLLFKSGEYKSRGWATVYTANASGRVQWGKGNRVNVLALIRAKNDPPQPETPIPRPKPPERKHTSVWAFLAALIGRLFSWRK